MNRPRDRVLTSARALLLGAAFLIVPATLARAQGFGYGGFPGSPGFGYAGPGYGFGYGYSYPGFGVAAYPGFTAGYGFYGGYPAVVPPPVYPNPLFGLGLSPLGVQSALTESAIINGSRTRYSDGYYGRAR